MKKRQPFRAPSPTLATSFSEGISSYREGAPAAPTIDYRLDFKTHYAELTRYLANYPFPPAPNSRPNARTNLKTSTIQLVHEVSTDVYDELIRRNNKQDVPFLPNREEFHPKRNRARKNMANLSTANFKKLSSYMYFELERRYPEFNEDLSWRGLNALNVEDNPASDFPSNSPGRTSTNRDQQTDSGYDGSVSSWPSEPDFDPGRRSKYAYLHNPFVQRQKPQGFVARNPPYRSPLGQQPHRFLVEETLEDSKPEHQVNPSPALASPLSSTLVKEEEPEESVSEVNSGAYSYTDSTDYGVPYTRIALSDESDVHF